MKLKEYPLYFWYAAKTYLLGVKVPHNKTTTANCIVSLTSIPSRLHSLHLTLDSIFLQSTPPKKVILWLHDSHKASVPRKLEALVGECFEIRFSRKNSSHLKLVESLLSFPNETVVVCDDDVIYHKHWLASLLADHKTFPSDIIANECRQIAYQENGELFEYERWPYVMEKACTSMCLLPLGYGGVLYPPHSLNSDVVDESLYMALSPKADDLWFKAMSLLNKTTVRRSSSPPPKPIPIAGLKTNALSETNIKLDGNRKQWRAICEHYQLNLLD